MRRVIAESFRVPLERVRVISEFVGGSFGAKGGAWNSCLTLAVAVAQWAKRPVRLELSRAQMFTLVGRRQETIQRVRLGATQTGRLAAIRHDTIAQTSAFAEYADPVGTLARVLYACDNVAVTHRLVRTNAPQPNPMRAPGEGPGSFALETALDELASKLNMDPIELRLRNYADHDQHTGLPWSSNGLPECYGVGAAAFGWDRRVAAVGATREKHLLIGSGMASACYPVYRMASEAAVRMSADGSLTVRCGTQDVGAGTYTVLAQLVADILGVPLRLVSVALGDTALPEGPVSGGAMATASFTPSVEAAARLLRERVVSLATNDPRSALFGVPAADLSLHDGLIEHAGSGHRETLSELVTRNSPNGLEECARTAPDEKPRHSGYSHGAVFAEVSVDPDLGEVRVRRITAAYASGRLLNPRLVRSQYIGGLIGGIGMALHEATLTDEPVGQVVNDNLSDYLIPVHADLPHFDIHYIPQDDAHLGGGIKGVGMIGTVGTAAAIANAVYHACGRRVRSLPIRLEHIL
jgi:xanthine dehydrogenase YagR molybdenum-binding subunit